MTAPAPAGTPPPPPGPGVVPPFPAPPTEGRSGRMWLGLGIGVLALVLCFGGGAAALIGIVVVSTGAANEQAQAAVRDHIENLKAERYAEAYANSCDSLKAQMSQTEFARQAAAEPRIASYTLGDLRLTEEFLVAATLTYSDGRVEQLDYVLEQDTSPGTLKVCGRHR